jgi:hypothetical protein
MSWKGYKSLKEAFSAGTTPDPAEMRGYFKVRLVTGILPDIRFFLHNKFFPMDVETKGGGFNEFLGLVRIGNFIIERSESMLGDGQRVLKIIYDREGNPFFVRILTDEIKKLSDGFYLGRGVFNIRGKVFNMFYFTVEKLRV